MKITKRTPKQSLNKAFLKQRVFRDDINLFKANLQTLLSKISQNESEEHQKNCVRDFLKDTFYKSEYEINTKGRQDLVIHIGKYATDRVGVILEAKKPTNKAHMISSARPNQKALHELILYFMRERVDENNIDIKHLIVTNINEWFIFDASVFNQLFFDNTSFVKEYKDWRDKQKITGNTDLFYSEIARPYVEAIVRDIPCTYFDLRDYDTALTNEDLKDDVKLVELFKILSPFHLLRIPFVDDSNTLDKKFYTELLHIIGLEELKEKGKLKIQRKAEERRDAGSLLENAITIIETKDCMYKVKNLESYGSTKEERLFGVALELCLTWVNRVLFLKLLEAQLVSYHKGNREYRFLDIANVHDFDELFTLFHQVLARLPDERKANIRKKYAGVPYLNSSLFEISDLEDQTITIESLKDTIALPFVTSTILKEAKSQKNDLRTLEYLFKFLDAYDFASEGTEGIKENNRSLINASVLGKVFEKINGYKEGSIYTPGLITMYMCRQAIRLAVLQKFKTAYGWNISELSDIKNYLADHKSTKEVLEFNALLNSLRVCDPAVGSGHFLVSSLNEIIAIKSELGIFADDKGERFRDIEITVENDELTIFDSERNEFFKYQINDGKPSNKEAHRLQRTLFHEKQIIIENSLFGVDVNPNSVKICRLRLWIELLKNAYYKESTNFRELETLPNIDINIKEGNSLVSRFTLDADLHEVLKKVKYSIEDYRHFVLQYKETRDREKKRLFENTINEIKGDFKTQLFYFSPERRELADLENQLRASETKQFLFGETEDEHAKRQDKEKQLKTKIEKKKDTIKLIEENVIYKNAFEWRFEFPEVLDNEGDFKGFDIVIGNPPYIDSEKMVNVGLKSLRDYIVKTYRTTKGNWDIYIAFIEKGFDLLNSFGSLILITPDKWVSKPFGDETRATYLKHIHSVLIAGRDVFESAIVDSIITLFLKSQSSDLQILKTEQTNNIILLNSISKTLIKPPYALDFLFSAHLSLLLKIEDNHKPFSDFLVCESACATSDAYKLKPLVVNQRNVTKDYFTIINTGTIGKFVSRWGQKEMTYLKDKYLYPVINKNAFQNEFTNSYYYKSVQPKIMIKGLTLLDACIDLYGEVIPGKSTLVIADSDVSKLKVALGLINSNLFFFYISEKYSASSYNEGVTFTKGMINTLPLPRLESAKRKQIERLVNKIISIKQADAKADTSQPEREINYLVYQLYNITRDEQTIIEGKDGTS